MTYANHVQSPHRTMCTKLKLQSFNWSQGRPACGTVWSLYVNCAWALHVICICHIILTQDLIRWFTESVTVRVTTCTDLLWIVTVINMRGETLYNHSTGSKEHQTALRWRAQVLYPQLSATLSPRSHIKQDIYYLPDHILYKLQRQTHDCEQGWIAPWAFGESCQPYFPPCVVQF